MEMLEQLFRKGFEASTCQRTGTKAFDPVIHADTYVGFLIGSCRITQNGVPVQLKCIVVYVLQKMRDVGGLKPT